jgi:hypothetical protein
MSLAARTPVRGASICGGLAQPRPTAAAIRPPRVLRVTAMSENTPSTSSPPSSVPPPANPAAVVDQAYNSVRASWQAGKRRQSVQIIFDLLDPSSIDDWPGGIRQMAKAAGPMCEQLLRRLKVLPGLEGPLTPRIIDDADAVCAWEGDRLSLVLFPTAETLAEVRKAAERAEKAGALFLIVNPQWTADEGQIISDFGVFPWQRAAAKEFLSSFSDGYSAQNLRINGDYCQWLYTYPAGWQVSVITGPGSSECILSGATRRPTYQEVEAMLRKLTWTMSSKSLAERIVAEAEFNRRSVQSQPPESK